MESMNAKQVTIWISVSVCSLQTSYGKFCNHLLYIISIEHPSFTSKSVIWQLAVNQVKFQLQNVMSLASSQTLWVYRKWAQQKVNCHTLPHHIDNYCMCNDWVVMCLFKIKKLNKKKKLSCIRSSILDWNGEFLLQFSCKILETHIHLNSTII